MATTATQAFKNALPSTAKTNNTNSSTTNTKSSLAGVTKTRTGSSGTGGVTVQATPATSASSAAVNAVNQATSNRQSTGSSSQSTGTSTAGVTSGYTPLGTYNDAQLRSQGSADPIDQYKAEYEAAKARGDLSGMQAAHTKAEMYRSTQGYSGGSDGSQYIPTSQNTGAVTWSTQYDLPSAQDTRLSLSAYDARLLSDADQAIMRQLKQEYANAEDAGDTARMQSINQSANALRGKYGYSLGSDGATYTQLPTAEDILYQSGLPAYQANLEGVNSVYDQLNDASLAQIMAAYNNSRAESEYQMGKLPAQYQAQRNAAAADNEREKAAFREQAAASGLNAGNGSQASLAFSSQLQNTLGQLNTAEANALADAQHELTQLYNNYQQEIATAVAQNNYQRAAALLDEYRTAQESAVNTALQQANYNLSVAEFNRQTRQNEVQNQLQNWQNNFNLASFIADTGGNFGPIGTLANLSQAEIDRMRANYALQQVDWKGVPYLKGYGYTV